MTITHLKLHYDIEEDMEDFLTIRDIMEKFKVSRTTVYAWMNSGKLKYYKFERLVRFRADDVENFVEKARKTI